jgi:aarF domain-containing kinase
MGQELDFVSEGRNCERAGGAFSDPVAYSVPRIHWDVSNRHVLVMEFIDNACRVNDVSGLAERGINTAQVARLTSELFAEQIFVHGFVHGDPHPGNMFVRRRPGSPSEVAGVDQQPLCDPKDVQLVLLDHGLYRTLDPDLRKTYCDLWSGAILRDHALVAVAAEKLVGPRFADLFQLVLLPTNRYASKPVADGHATVETRERFREQFRKLTSVEGDDPSAEPTRDDLLREVPKIITEMFEQTPRDLFVVFKTQTLVRALLRELHATGEVDRHLLMGRAAFLGRSDRDRETDDGILTQLGDRVTLGWFDLNVRLMRFLFWAFRRSSPSPGAQQEDEH